MPKQQLQLTLQPDVINGFSFSFCSSLVAKLKQLMDTGRLYSEDEEDYLTPIARCVSEHLTDQVRGDEGFGNRVVLIDEVKKLINCAEEFLAAFKK